LWRAQHPTVGKLTIGGEVKKGRHWAAQCRCQCGAELVVLYTELRAGQTQCRSCASTSKWESADHSSALARLREIGKKGAAANAEKHRKWSPEQKRLSKVMSCARDRCRNERNKAYVNYGGRGIRFCFESVEAATRWVETNLGLPGDSMTVDRIDNDRHYEPGNLRWATRAEQARNKRRYKNALPGLPEAKMLRPDLSDSQLRAMLKQGRTMEEIKGWVKYASSRV